MTSPWTQCINGLDEIGIAREGLQYGHLIGPQEPGNTILLPIQMRELELGKRIFEVTPDLLNRGQLGTIGWQEYQAHVFRQSEALGCRRAAVIQEQKIQAVAEGLREGVDEEQKHLRVQRGQSQEEPTTRGVPHGPIDGEPFEDLLDVADGLHPSDSETL
jgi:hypothetical protein